MPYASPTRPSMALGLLKAILAEGGITAAVAYANLWFAESVGLRRYSLCASNLPIVFLAGEWTFAGAAFGDDPRRAERDAEYLRQVRQASDGYPQVWSGARGREFTADLLALRAAATEFVDEAARRVLATGARVVGCTSTFEQHVASLALLRRVRELDPGVITILGGANCETVMGEATHRCFGWVDYVVSGEADGLVTELCRLALTRGRDVPADELPRGVLGPAHRETARRPASRAVRGHAPLATASLVTSWPGRCSATWTACPRRVTRTTSRRWPRRRWDPACGRACRWNPRADAGGARPTSARSAG